VRDLLFDHAPARGTGKIYDHHDYRAEIKATARATTAAKASATTPPTQ
jgi:hypothetical protein